MWVDEGCVRMSTMFSPDEADAKLKCRVEAQLRQELLQWKERCDAVVVMSRIRLCTSFVLVFRLRSRYVSH